MNSIKDINKAITSFTKFQDNLNKAVVKADKEIIKSRDKYVKFANRVESIIGYLSDFMKKLRVMKDAKAIKQSSKEIAIKNAQNKARNLANNLNKFMEG